MRDTEAMAEYAKRSMPALEAAGGKVIARGLPTAIFELGTNEQALLIELENAEAAVAAYASPAYQAAHAMLGGCGG